MAQRPYQETFRKENTYHSIIGPYEEENEGLMLAFIRNDNAGQTVRGFQQILTSFDVK